MSQNPSGNSPWQDPAAQPQPGQPQPSAQPAPQPPAATGGYERTQPVGEPAAAPRQPAAETGNVQSQGRGDRGSQPQLDPNLDGRAKGGATGAMWVALIIGLILLVLLLVFVLQNMNDVLISYMAWEFTLPLGVAMLLAAVAGGLIMAMVGSIRLIVVSRRLHKLEKERESIKRTLR